MSRKRKQVMTSLDVEARQQARQHTAKQLDEGRIGRRPCEVCGAEPAQAHHIDYSDPGRVMWLCSKHHGQTHSQFAKPAPIDWMADIRAAQRRIDALRLEVRRGRAAHSRGSSDLA